MASSRKPAKLSKGRTAIAASKKRKRLPLEPNRVESEKKKKKKDSNINSKEDEVGRTKSKNNRANDMVQLEKASQRLSFFLYQYQSANSIKLSSLELESITEKCMLEHSQNVSSVCELTKTAFGPSWKEILCESKLLEGKMDPGHPAVLIVSSSALRSLELLRELRPLTQECHAAKLFAKHMKISDQVSLLKNRINIASGTPSRIKKLIDMEALGLSRLTVLVLDMHTDIKGYSLLTLPQVRDEFWDIYKSHFHQLLVDGVLRICLFGPILASSNTKIEVEDV